MSNEANEFDAAVGSSLQAQRESSARLGLSSALGTNPDTYANAQRLARRAGVPVETAANLPNEIQQQVRMGEIDFATLAKTSPATAAFIADVDKARGVHDDVEGMTGVENALYSIGKYTVGGTKALASAPLKFNEGAWGLARAGADVLPDAIGAPLAKQFAEYGRSQRTLADNLVPKGNIVEGGFYSGMQSLGLNLLQLPLGLGGKMAPILTSMGATTGGQAYGEARDKGRGVAESLAFGTSQGVIEAGTEMIGMPALFSMLKPGQFGAKAVEYLWKEQFGEQIATHLQDLNEWAVLNPDKTFGEYLAARPGAAVQTAIATAVGGGGMVAVMKGAELIVNRDQDRAQRAERDAQAIEGLNSFVAASKVLTRDPETFAEFVASAAENAPVQQVFLDANTLMQSGIAEQLAEVSPAVAEQLAEALQTGGQIAIPVEEYAARIAPTEYAQGLLDHLKTDPEGFSRAEAKEYMQSYSDELQREVARVLTEKEGDDTFKQSADVVKTSIKTQLDTAARFTPQVNDAYASLVGNFFAVQAARLGITPEEMYQRYPLRVGAEAIGGPQFDQPRYTRDQLLELFANADTINVDATDAANGVTEDEARFLSNVPAGTRFTHSTRLLGRVRRTSEIVSEHLGGNPKTTRSVESALGPFSAYEVAGEVQAGDDTYNPGGALKVRIYGKEQVEAGLMDEPALTFTVMPDGELSVNGPTPGGATFAAFAERGWAEQSKAGDQIAEGWSNLKAADGGKLPMPQVLNLLADVHARVRAWRGEDRVGLYWSRATGASAGLGDYGSAVFFQTPGETGGGVYNQDRKAKRDDYTLDLFGVPDSGGADTAPQRPAARRQKRQLSRNDAPGTYAARTEIVQENTRQLGTDRVNTPEDAAQAMAYLARSAVERFDALITDKNGKPLAIVGAFKGALTQASVYPATLAGEAFRIKGAANIWFAHNHPSGANELSNADRALHGGLAEVFRGSAIKPHGIFAIAGKEGEGRNWVFEPTPKIRNRPEPDVRGVSFAPAATASVPVVERVYTEEGRLGPAISSPAIAKSAAKDLSGGEAGVLLLTSQNEPVAFVPVNPAEAGALRQDGRMDALYRALSVSNAAAAIVVNNGAMTSAEVQNLAGLFNSLDARVLDVLDISGSGRTASWAEQGKSFNATTFEQGNRGSFNPETNLITLLKGADLSTFLHESGHFFLEVQADLAAKLQQEADLFGLESLQPGERQILADTSALLDWFGVKSVAEWHNLDIEEKRSYHEQFARGFEAYLFEGRAPSIELQGLFQRFRAWMLNVYRDLKNLNVELTDDVRGVFDRMLASGEQITLAEQGRSMMPLFTAPEQAGMTPAEFAAYQALGVDATNDAIQDLQARGLRDMQWLRNAHGRVLKKLQKEAKAKRAEVQMDVRREVMSEPIYQAWQFLTGRMTADEQIDPLVAPKSDPNSVDETMDSLFVAIAKLGGMRKEEVTGTWGTDPADKPQSGVFGKPVWRREGGLSIDGMAEALSQYGYLTPDENGKVDLAEFEALFDDELRGTPRYSSAYAPEQFAPRAGDQVANPAALAAGRLDRASLAEMGMPQEIIDHLDALRMVRRDALHPDLVAERFGFSSGDELVRRLAVAESPKAVIEALTDVAMLERYGELATPAALERAADKAIHNDARARLITTEANALAKATGQRKVLASAAREYAAALIARLKVRNIKPGQYASAEVRAAKAAEKASKAGDLGTAAAEKRNQLIQNYATRAAYEAQDEVDKGLRYLKKFEGVVKGLDASYADQIGNLLERFDLRKGQSNKAVDKRTALAEWLTAQREAGFEPEIPAALENEAFRTSYKNLTVEEFRGVVDTVRQIEHLGRLKNTLLTAREQRAYEAVRDEITGSILDNAGDREANARTPTTKLGRMAQGLKRFWASHIKAAIWARVMDGGKDGGPVWEYLVRPANERGDMETTMRAEATAKLTQIMAPIFAQGKMGGKGLYFPTLGRSFNREARIAIALNWGNDGNRQRLAGGEGWSPNALLPVLQALTVEEWQAVQAVWDHLDSYRPQIAAKERRVYGREPEWVTPIPFTIKTAGGQEVSLRGGYYPIKYDPAASQRAEEHNDAEGAKRQLQGAYTTATTRRSFTKARAEEVSGRPLLYTLSGMYAGVNDVIHDLAWHEWLIDANRLLRSKSIDSAIRDHYGPEAKQQLKQWAADIAEGDKGASNGVDLFSSYMRQSVSLAGLGFNVMSAAIQPLGVTQSIVRVGAGWVARGVVKYLANPVALTRAVNGMSSFMENRARTRFRELNELRNAVEDQSALKEWIGRYAYFLMMRCQQMVDVPTWWGAYEKAIAEGNDDTRSIELADQAVIDSQGGGMTKDLSGIERGGPTQKLFTVFYSFMNSALNLGVSKTMTADTPAKKGKLAADYLLLYVLPPLLGYALKNALIPGDSGDDDTEKVAKKLLAAQIDYLMGMMVGVREFSDAAKTATGANDMGMGYAGPAGLRPVGDAAKLAQQAHQGEFDDAFRKAAVNLASDLLALPGAQINRTITGAKALADGKTSNPAALAFGFQEKR